MQIGHRKGCFKSWRCEHKPLEEQGRANEGLTLKKSALKFFGGCLICSTNHNIRFWTAQSKRKR